MTWLQNAFDSVPHEWLMKKLLLEKLPEHLIRAIENSTSRCTTIEHLKGKEEVIVSNMYILWRKYFKVAASWFNYLIYRWNHYRIH